MTKRALIIFLCVTTAITCMGCSPEKAKKDLNKFFSDKQESKEPVDINLTEAGLLPSPREFNLPRDPFRPIVFEPSTPSVANPADIKEDEIRLAGVIVMEGRSRAVLDVPVLGARVFKEGDTIGKYKIKKISAKKVFLEKDGSSLELKIGDGK